MEEGFNAGNMVGTHMSTVLGEDGSEEDALILKLEGLTLAGLLLLLQNTLLMIFLYGGRL